MQSREIRRRFLKYFSERGHRVVPSAPIVVKDDPTLMFTNAGMNQFKDFFLGTKKAVDSRVADTQKCLRVSGKHNDLEEVGVDTYHHTMFEMLGNWSFGDYFKKEAIEWSWDLLVNVYGIDESRLYATVFSGDVNDNLKLDDEAEGLWKEFLPENRVLLFDKSDNFWEMGDTGPCGPCSEIHIDLRSDKERDKISGASLVNTGHSEVIEIWNLVFMQYNRKADGSLENLQNTHVDTGMGFERLSMVLQGKKSSYDSDVFRPLIKRIEDLSGTSYGKNKETDIALRVISDHVRAIAFAVADGQLPSNSGAGYVIRRILRRAVRYGYTALGMEKPFIFELVQILVQQFDEVFPELTKQQSFIEKVIKEEEASFLRTLGNGIKRFKNLENAASTENTISGKDAFELYDTYGFPVDLTRLMARERGMEVDEKGFHEEMKLQRDRARRAGASQTDDWQILIEDDKEEFVGYDRLETNVRITRYRKVQQKKKTFFQLVFQLTPFYAESGGQVGDTGWISHDEERIRISDTKKENDLTVHITEELPKHLEATFRASVDANRRLLTTSNHTATHLLHAALREVLGDHVQQKGSLVDHHHLRFDFAHFARLEEEEIKRVEEIVNDRIRMDTPLEEDRNVPYEEAIAMGATALFGEKYGDTVRVITFDQDFSRELCGGTHVPSTGKIGLFKITQETSVSAGVRRIEAVTSVAAKKYYDDHLTELRAISGLIKNTKSTVEGVKSLLDENQNLKKSIEALNKQQAGQLQHSLKGKVKEVDGVNFLIEKVSLQDMASIKTLAFNLEKELENSLILLASESDEKANLTLMISKEITESKGWNAGNLIRDWAKEIKGGGGGQAFFATAGGKDPSGIENALEKARIFAQQSVSGA